ncbi:MAG TPA: hypothetical protein VH934_06410 [Xanthobacteraceae bacterium]|jgi:hypothetical protein
MNAEACRRMASDASNRKLQTILLEMARTWLRLALEAERFEQLQDQLKEGRPADKRKV